MQILGALTAVVVQLPAVGTQVLRGQVLLVLESMKMEHVVAAPRAGRLAELLVAAGDQVTRDQLLGRID